MISAEKQPSTKAQREAIMKNCAYQIDTKNEYVQWVTGDVNQTSLRAISFDQAQRIIQQQTGQTAPPTENWAKFDFKNQKHKLILSLCRQLQWTVQNDRHGEVADLNRLSAWLQSDKSPVQKPLLKMSGVECEKIITALKQIFKSRFR